MSRISIAITATVLLVASAWPALAAEPQERTFKLLRESIAAERELQLEEEEAQRWEPELQVGEVELSFSLGFLDLNTALLSHDQIIYKYTDTSTYWGDVTIKGQSAFSPLLRVNYNLNTWLGFEGIANFSVCDYESTVENRVERGNGEDGDIDPDEPALGDYDGEKRSLATFLGALNVIWYPMNMDGDSKGRWHPFVTAGYGKMWYNMNSDYTDGTADTTDLNFGGGIRFLMDKSVSIRFDISYHKNSIEFTPAEYFKELDEGTKLIPLDEFPVIDGSIDQRSVSSFDSQDISSLQWALGFQVTF